MQRASLIAPPGSVFERSSFLYPSAGSSICLNFLCTACSDSWKAALLSFALEIGDKWESCWYLGAVVDNVPHCYVLRPLNPILKLVRVEEVLSHDPVVGQVER